MTEDSLLRAARRLTDGANAHAMANAAQAYLCALQCAEDGVPVPGLLETTRTRLLELVLREARRICH
jgi:hypothetical protein